mmetsp:Transcript_37641/g.85458  ORF Transcript_37641/g.85458 Transcript_37641/m.85458 type:complete len:292 (-) Transcript_37641:31-906(-)
MPPPLAHTPFPHPPCISATLELGRVREHFADEWEGHVGSREGRHHLSSVWLDAEGVKARDLEPLGSGDETEDANLRKTAIVDFGEQCLLLAFGRHVLSEAKRIPEVERHRVWEAILERWKVARLATADVVLLPIHLERGRRLRPHLEETNHADDLHLCGSGKRIPLVCWPSGSRDVSERDCREIVAQEATNRPLDIPWEADSIGLHAVADKRKHGDAAVLDLGVTQEANRGIIALRPEVGRPEAERVKVTNRGIELGREGLELLRHHRGRRARCDRRRPEGRRRRERKGSR